MVTVSYLLPGHMESNFQCFHMESNSHFFTVREVLVLIVTLSSYLLFKIHVLCPVIYCDLTHVLCVWLISRGLVISVSGFLFLMSL